jgi:hypothetical protein
MRLSPLPETPGEEQECHSQDRAACLAREGQQPWIEREEKSQDQAWPRFEAFAKQPRRKDQQRTRQGREEPRQKVRPRAEQEEQQAGRKDIGRLSAEHWPGPLRRAEGLQCQRGFPVVERQRAKVVEAQGERKPEGQQV